MKSVDEIAKHVFEKRDAYDREQRRKKKILRSTLIPVGAAAAAVLVLAPVFVFRNGIRSSLEAKSANFSSVVMKDNFAGDKMSDVISEDAFYDEIVEEYDDDAMEVAFDEEMDAGFEEEIVYESEEAMDLYEIPADTEAAVSGFISVSDLREENNMVFLKLTNTSSSEAVFSCKDLFFECTKDDGEVSSVVLVYPNEDASDCGTVSLLPSEEMDYGFSLTNFTFSEPGDYVLNTPFGETEFVHTVN